MRIVTVSVVIAALGCEPGATGKGGPDALGTRYDTSEAPNQVVIAHNCLYFQDSYCEPVPAGAVYDAERNAVWFRHAGRDECTGPKGFFPTDGWPFVWEDRCDSDWCCYHVPGQDYPDCSSTDTCATADDCKRPTEATCEPFTLFLGR